MKCRVRELDWESALGQRVQIYRNTENGRMTIRNTSYRVLGHVTDCVIQNVTFRFCDRLQRKSQTTGRKTPHAWGLGTLIAQFPADLDSFEVPGLELGYDHRKYPNFYLKDGRDTPVKGCRYLVVVQNYVTVSL